MRLTFTLQAAYTGATYVAGPFNISGTTSAGTTYELATGVTKEQLKNGKIVDTTYETLTGGTITSTGTCGTSRNWYITQPAAATSVLSYDFSGGYYTFNLTEALQNAITISIANVELHDTFTCDASVDTSHIASTVTIPAGSYSATRISDITNFTSIVRWKRAAGLTLTTYGTKANNATFTIPAGTVVTVSLPTTCESYAT